MNLGRIMIRILLADDYGDCSMKGDVKNKVFSQPGGQSFFLDIPLHRTIPKNAENHRRVFGVLASLVYGERCCPAARA
jgi:hypothetical protein